MYLQYVYLYVCIYILMYLLFQSGPVAEHIDEQESKPGDKSFESFKTNDNGNIFHYTVKQKS